MNFDFFLIFLPNIHFVYEFRSCASILCTNWHPIAACLWGLTRRRINRFKYGRFSIFHQGFSSEMSFTANYAHGRVQSQSINFKPQQQHWNNRLKPLL